MPRATTPRIEHDALPEFLRSPAVGAVIAEALDNHNVVGESASGAVTSMVGDAAREIRDFHGLPAPSTGSDQVRALRDETHREYTEGTG